MALKGLGCADEWPLPNCKTEMVHHYNEVGDRYNMASAKKTNERASKCPRRPWDVSCGMTLANATQAKLVARDSVSTNQCLIQNQGLAFRIPPVQGYSRFLCGELVQAQTILIHLE